MMNQLLTAIFVLWAAPAVAQSSVTVRVFAPLPEEARRTVEDIFDQAGVRVTWSACTTCEPDNQALVLRLVERAPKGDPDEIGASFVDARTRRGSLSTVFLDRVRHVARGSGQAVERVLGFAVAHELGHLLGLQHRQAGVMQPRMTAAVLRRNPDMAFNADEVALLQGAVNETR